MKIISSSRLAIKNSTNHQGNKLHFQLQGHDKSDELHIISQEQELNDINRELVLSNIHVNGICHDSQRLEKYYRFDPVRRKNMLHTFQADFYRFFRSKAV